MTESSQHDLFASLIDDLANQGWSQRALFAPEVLTRELAAECRKRAHSGALNAASVGRGGAQQVQEGIRGDRIQDVYKRQARGRPSCPGTRPDWHCPG